LAHATLLQSIFQCDLTLFPCFHDLWEVLRSFLNRPSQMNITGSRGGDSFNLPLFYIVPLGFRDEAQDLQNKVSNEGSHQILAVPGVQERHVDHANVDSDLLRQNAPLPLKLLIITAQSVDA